MTAPRSAADPRPGGKPYYIDPNCPTCGTPLVLDDLLRDPNTPEDMLFHDEWVCPHHVESGVFIDSPCARLLHAGENKSSESTYGGIDVN